MKIRRRNSSLKYRKMTGFRRRMKTRNGRKILANQRRKKKNLA
ncbi:MAG: 50S ribosomal protein L34 [Planctomycetota bacterium]|jgi:ribosomal protein L34